MLNSILLQKSTSLRIKNETLELETSRKDNHKSLSQITAPTANTRKTPL